MTEIRIACRARLRAGQRERFAALVVSLHEAVEGYAENGVTVYDYYISARCPDLCYIHEGFERLSDFVAHMAAIRPLFLEYGDCLEVENLDICGELTADVERHFGEVYGERFSYFPKRIDGLHSST